MFLLSDLLIYKRVVIQCHDNPDADAIASGFALYTYLESKSVDVRLVYSGKYQITKSNLLGMIIDLSIPIYPINVLPETEALITVDCQYGEGNVTRLEAPVVVVIDHHKEGNNPYKGIINSSLGSCSTLVWELLRKENFPFEDYPQVSTALYYGLYTDTNSLSEISFPLDKDMRDSLTYDRAIIRKLQNTNLTLQELNIAGMALTQYKNNHDLGYAIFAAEPCDPNILGFISDLALQVDSIDACIVYTHMPDGAKLSVRSCTRQIMASDFIEFIADGVGTGGGHIYKAGGFINRAKVEALGMSINQYLEERTHKYFNSYDIIDSASHSLDLSSMPRYKKKKIPVGYVLSTDIFEVGVHALIRTLEGDAEAVASSDIYFMVGVEGEVYPIKADRFHNNYTESGLKPETNYAYPPTIRNRSTGEVKNLADYIKPCVAQGDTYVYAKPSQKNTKVFTSWNSEGYMSGKTGDYIVVRSEDINDVYIVREDIFNRTYELAEEV